MICFWGLFCFLKSIGSNMEMLARRALWQVGLNYGHGTGHGVGNYFGVHECMFSTVVRMFFRNESDNRQVYC